MLTASLQATWESQRTRPRPKYFQSQLQQSPGQGQYSEESSSESLGLTRGYSVQKDYGATTGLRSSAEVTNYPDLPNLRMPQAGGARSYLGPTANFGNAPLSTSPRSNAQKELMGMTLTKKLRNNTSSSRQSHGTQQRSAGKKYSRYGDSSGLQSLDAPSVASSSGDGMFPQLNHQYHQNGQSVLLAPQQPQQQQQQQQQYVPVKRGKDPYSNASHLLSPVNQSITGHIREQTTSNGVTTEEHGSSAVTSIKGLKPGNPNWNNQDNFFILENFEGKDFRVYCVLDGHGENGHHVSRRCRENFPHFIKSTNARIDLAFNMMHNDLNSSDIDVRCSGATCVMTTIVSNRLSVYNCGDSRIVLGRRNPNGSIIAQQLSNDHKPDKPEERKRILSCGGHLGCRQVLVNQGTRGPVSMPVGPCRVWYQHRGETLGLAMSRSLGDAIVHKFGVTAEPEITEHLIDDNDEFIILATDGVWDVVDNNHAVQMVHNFAMRSNSWSPLEASNCICKFARSRWEKLSPMVDDITCIVVKLHHS